MTNTSITWNEAPEALRTLPEKIEALEQWFRDAGSAVVAFSAGVDSTYLAHVATARLADRALAVTATSPSFPERELQDARALAAAIGIRHRVIESHELANPDYANNPAGRCFFCKNELYGLLRELAKTEGYARVVDGTNYDDLGDHRPGKKAADNQGVHSPLQELGFTKADIREAARKAGLRNADKPAFACLASRFPYGDKITAEGLRQVEEAENVLRDLGFGQLRVRVHGEIARLELAPEDLARAVDPPVRETIVTKLRACGYRHVTLDLQGYRRGSLNEVLGSERPTSNVQRSTQK